MKKILLLAALLLCCTPDFCRSGQGKLPFDKRISAEKLTLTEKYRSALETCRERSRKKAKEMCFERKRNEFSKNIADLERDPRAYFATQERNSKTERDLQEADLHRPRN